MTETSADTLPPIRYTIEPIEPAAHRFRVTCEVADPNPAGQVFSLPAWIPGSYMIREFARHILTLTARSGGHAVALSKLDKHTWQAPALPAGQSLVLEYDVYAWDLSVRAAHLDRSHGFFNGTSVFLAVHGRTGRACLVDIRPPRAPVEGDWRVATALAEATDQPGGAARGGFGWYRAGDYDELIDHPVEMGTFAQAAFDAGGARHEVVLTGRHDCDLPRLCADLQKICAWQIALFGAPAPVSRYLFMAMIVGDGYGGLEHRASTALLASRDDLPFPGMAGTTEGYKRFLGLCSHEYFHTWNVKRIKPAAFTPYDLSRENHTRLLWAFEGFTSYYDDLALVRSGVIGIDDYLELLGKTLASVQRGVGRLRQSVAESSFDAWTKYYRQDENAPNAIVSYYTKGSLVALALDLRLRQLGDGQGSLDDLMRALWQRHGQTGVGVGEAGVFELLAEVADGIEAGSGRQLALWLRQTVEGTGDLPLASLLKPFGVELQWTTAAQAPTLGLKLAAGEEVRIATVYDDGPAQHAGLSAGDVLVAWDGLKLSTASLKAFLARRRAGDMVELHAFRRDELMRFSVTLAPAPADSATLTLCEDADAAARSRRAAWLGA